MSRLYPSEISINLCSVFLEGVENNVNVSYNGGGGDVEVGVVGADGAAVNGVSQTFTLVFFCLCFSTLSSVFILLCCSVCY